MYDLNPKYFWQCVDLICGTHLLLTMDGSIPLTDLTNNKNSKNNKKQNHRPEDLEAQDAASILSGVSKDSFEEDRGVTCTDIKLIMPTVLILLFTLFIMVTVIPYAFSSVIKQLQAVWALEEQKAQMAADAALKASGVQNIGDSDCSCDDK